MLWVDKYRPSQLKRLQYHTELAKRLTNLGKTQNITHMLFYGPSGSGKKTRVMALLREMYGSSVNKTKLEFIHFKNRSGKSLEITATASTHHIEINASDVGNNDHYAVKVAIKQMAQTKSLGIAAALQGGNSSSAGAGTSDESSRKAKTFRVLVLTEADKLTKNAQQVGSKIGHQVY